MATTKQLTITTAMAAALATLPACSSGGDWNGDTYADGDTAICVDQNGNRIDEDRCDKNRYYSGGGYNGYYWYYLGRRSMIPYYGESIRDARYARYGGGYSPRAGASYASAPMSTRMSRSRAVSRGGLGSSGRSFGSGRS